MKRSAYVIYEWPQRDTQPNEAVQMLNIILSYGISIDPTRYEVIGRKYFQPNGGRGHVEQLGKVLYQV